MGLSALSRVSAGFEKRDAAFDVESDAPLTA